MKSIQIIISLVFTYSILLSTIASGARPLDEETLSNVDLINDEEDVILVEPEDGSINEEGEFEITVMVPWDGEPFDYAVTSQTDKTKFDPKNKEAFEDGKRREIENQLTSQNLRAFPEPPPPEPVSFPITAIDVPGGSLVSTPNSFTLSTPYAGSVENFSNPYFDVTKIGDQLKFTVKLPQQ